MGIVKTIHRKFDYEQTDGYKIVILDVHPRYDIRAPDNNFIKDFDYLNLIKEFERHQVSNFNFYFKKGRIFLPIPIEIENSWNLADKLVDNLHKAATRRLKDSPNIRLNLYIHEHSVCVRSNKCLWRQFIDLINTQGREKFNYRIHIVKSETIILNGCRDVSNDRDLYTRSPI